ncbi:MAG: leucine-rich repeat domain-containing protein [Clostridia bacterium]|nr:leucine-rich repeat domain-containing protein [Clostridia bacterium]
MKRKFLITCVLFAAVTSVFALTACDGGHTHSGNTMRRNDSEHFKVCAECQAYYDEEAHTPVDGVCTVCGYVVGYTQGLELQYLHGGGYAVTGLGTATEAQIVIPSYYVYEPVIAISERAFENSAIKSVVIPDTVTKIEDRAFSGCTALESVTFGAHTEELGSAVFKGCTALKEMVLPQGIPAINDHLFESCTALKSVTVPDSVKKIDFQAFIFCGALEEVIVSDESKLVEIANGAFSDCKKLKTFEFPQGFQTIGSGAFGGCESLNNIVLPDSLIDVDGFAGCTSLSTIKFGNAVETIAKSAFERCAALQAVSLPATLKNIGAFAFSSCNALADLYFAGTQTQWDEVEQGEFWNQKEGDPIHLHINATN